MENRKNLIIKRALFEAGMKQYELAQLLNMREESLSKKMRYEFPEEEQQEIAEKIKKYSEERND